MFGVAELVFAARGVANAGIAGLFANAAIVRTEKRSDILV
jgi:hypothetical protein